MKVEVEGPGDAPIVLDDGRLTPYRELLERGEDAEPVRTAFAATHVVMAESYGSVPHSLERPGSPEEIAEHIDWRATMQLRRRLDAHGFGVAEAMDTAQRFQLGWQSAERLIRGCSALDLAHGFVAGAGVDHLQSIGSKRELIDGVVLQARTIQAAGGIAILLPLEWLAANRLGEADYVEVYGDIFAALDGPLLVHWMDEKFLPSLVGYFPGESFSRVMALDPGKVRGAKLSLLDADLERRVRAELLPRGQVVFTGDDLHFAELILGQGEIPPPVEGRADLGRQTLALGRFSHALLGVLDAVHEPAGLALRFLARGDSRRYLELMRPCEVLGQWLFQQPTQHYKAGLAFLSWLNGAQPNALLVNHEERARDRGHYLRAAELAARAGVLADARLASQRLEQLPA